MNSRPIIQGKKLRIYLDSESFVNLLDKEDKNAKILLNWTNTYQDLLDSEITYKDIWTNYIEFFRSPFDSDYDKLNEIRSYEFKLNENFDRQEFVMHYGPMTFSHEMTELKCKHLLNNVKPDMLEKITSLMVNFYEFCIREDEEARASCDYRFALVGCISDNTNLLVTNNKYLLKNRIRLERSLIDSHYFSKYPLYYNYPLNIVTIKETSEIIDLFLKYRNLYYYGNTDMGEAFIGTNKVKGTASYTTEFNESEWYFTSFTTKVPYYYRKDNLSESFSIRFIFLLMCIDEIGKLYYQGVNDTTQMGILYNFNYFISLVTGLFDNLALITNEKYKIFSDKKKVSLNPDNTNDFISELKTKDMALYEHIHDNIDFLRIIHKLRNRIIHQEMFNMAFLESGEVKLNTLIINEEIVKYLRCYPKEINKTNRLELWGVRKINVLKGSEQYLIEPFHFSKEAAKVLIKFSNNYLELLGNSNFVEKFMEKYKDTLHNNYFMIEDFNRVNLGF